jgi:hypothetical protein
MTEIDYGFLAVAILALAILLAGSKVMRAIFLETIRHPFRASRIECQAGQVTVITAEKESRSPAGAL